MSTVLSVSVWDPDTGRASLEGALLSMIGIECLLLVTLAVIVASATPDGAPRAFGTAVAGAVSLVAIGAAAAWYRKYLPDFPDMETDAVEAIGLLVAVLAPALLAWWLALGARRR